MEPWTYNEAYGCWCLEDVLYTARPTVPEFQRLSIFVPRAYLNGDGTVNPAGTHGPYTAKTAPVVFENNAAGYKQMPNTHLGEPRCYAGQYLEQGLIYVSCGCRGRESRDASGCLVGKSPATLVDLKTAIRFLRRHRDELPGDWDKLISVGWSAGGAMSSLLALSGDNQAFLPYLKENGAFLEESDWVFAAQIYCPIVDLEHADLAYEWMFRADRVCERPQAVPPPFQQALSQNLSRRYVTYFNALGLRDPATGMALTLGPDGRSGSGYNYFLSCLDDSATKFLTRQDSVTDYLEGKDWLTWDGSRAHVSGLDTYVLRHRRRMKPCTAFDRLEQNSAENQVFGSETQDFMHFSEDVAQALEDIRDRFPEEYGEYAPAFGAIQADGALSRRVALFNPLTFIAAREGNHQAAHYRIRVGASDADTSLSVSMTLALRLANAGCGEVDYAMVWDQPHCEADYPGEICAWIHKICCQGKSQEV